MLATLVSSCVANQVIDVVPGSEDCHAGCKAAAAGWPYPYIVDGHGLSPHGSADLMGLLMGIDRLDLFGVVLNFAAWLAILLIPMAAWLMWRSRAARKPSA
ncbi:MAG TPA: hypothetical protein VF800_23080 [Telluria sp.]